MLAWIAGGALGGAASARIVAADASRPPGRGSVAGFAASALDGVAAGDQRSRR